MPLILDESAIGEAALLEILRGLDEDLRELAEAIAAPRERVLEPASLRTAAELLESARAALERSAARDRDALIRDANLAYATTLAVIDLLKTHTAGPKVPRRRA